MATQFQTLPPLKRFRLMQQQQEDEENKENIPPPLMPSSSSPQLLPAKKRIESRKPPLQPLSPPRPAAAAAVAYSLPTKKRVWAFQPPDLNDDEYSVKPLPPPPFLPLDLNVQYDPRCDYEEGHNHNRNEKKRQEENHKIPLLSSQSTESTQADGENEISQIVSEEEDEDGILCAVCGSTDGDPSDPIVFCDGCDLMVHTTCYGAPLINGVPEGDWFCAECSVPDGTKNRPSLSCCLCPKQGGGLKPTKKDGVWAHIVCALLIPEVFFEDPDGREGIDCSKVPKRRWREKCYVCKSRGGCVMDCSERNCPLAFHITCGLKEELCIEYRDGGSKGKEAIVAGFCRTHTELWEKQQGTGKYKIVARGG
ncbi:unnamed protein product [Linum tenue]|uniref:Protein Jade-1 n=1 Tax=Linum tenue TaxID=586396 RepID=A0AAV0M4J0_9ROSI|nr:unnamed protein product [Linum tenue]